MGQDNSLLTWNLIEQLGAGGNGEVWRAERGGQECALKVLRERRVESESYRRFVHEVEVLRQIESEQGVLPILDAHLPERPTKNDKAWLAMPLAQPLKNALAERPKLEDVVSAISSIAQTLSKLAKSGICHRDLKPENLYRHKGDWAIGDFGLVDFPGKDDVTQEGRAIGPRFYIAPEMVRDPINASGFPADVWSLAKTMWVLATGQNYPPPHPQPASDRTDTLAVLISHKRAYLLDNLIERATQKEPNDRPTMEDFAQELKSWLASNEEPHLDTDVDDLVHRIKISSQQYHLEADGIARSIEAAKSYVEPLSKKLSRIGEVFSQMNLKFNSPLPNGQNLLTDTIMERTKYGGHGVTVSVYTPPPTTHLFESGILIQILDDGHHRIYAAHQITPHQGKKISTWEDCQDIQFGTAKEDAALDQMTKGLYDNLRQGLEQFACLIEST